MDKNVVKAGGLEQTTELFGVSEREPCSSASRNLGADVARHSIPQRHKVGGWSGEHAESDAACRAQDAPHLMESPHPIREELKSLLAHHDVERSVIEWQS
jgi:hypothetical protein